MKIHLLTGTGTIAKLLCRSKPAGVGAEACDRRGATAGDADESTRGHARGRD